MNRKILKGVIYLGLFAVPFIPLLVSGELFFPFITTKAFAWRIIVEVILAAWALLAYLDPFYRPRRSVIAWSLLVFLVVIGLSDISGVAPVKSFWSNFERMEGFVSLLHLGAFFLVVGSFFREREWKWWWNTSLGASAIVCIYSFFQLAGSVPIHQGGVRVDATLGNAAYLAVYILIHIFIALFLLARDSRTSMKWVYGALIFVQLIVLYNTATRGAILGLLGGLLLTALLNVRNKAEPRVRRASLVGIVVFVVLVGGFFLARHTSFIEKSPVLSRFSSISISEVKTEGRSFIWPMALKGIGEKPLFGWGQENFNYVFGEHYSPLMYNLEPWFDRAHNIFLDWGVAGGSAGLIGYFALYIALMMSVWKKGTTFSQLDKSILSGLLAAYFFHNLFVFDHLVSYILFGALLAYVHAATKRSVHEKSVSSTEREATTLSLSIPVGVLLLLVLYFVNVKPIIGNSELINGLQAIQTTGQESQALGHFQKAYNASRLGRPEVVEWISTSADSILGSATVSMDDQNAYYAFAKEVVMKQADELSTDARYQLLAGSFLARTGSTDQAFVYLGKAEKLMPNKQAIYFEEGSLALAKQDYKGSLAFFKKAYDLAPGYQEARIVYLIGAIYAGDKAVVKEMIAGLPSGVLSTDNRITGALYTKGEFADLIAVLQSRLNLDPKNPQNYADLAVAYYKAGQKANAITILETLKKQMPEYKTQAEEYIKAIQGGTL